VTVASGVDLTPDMSKFVRALTIRVSIDHEVDPNLDISPLCRQFFERMSRHQGSFRFKLPLSTAILIFAHTAVCEVQPHGSLPTPPNYGNSWANATARCSRRERGLPRGARWARTEGIRKGRRTQRQQTRLDRKESSRVPPVWMIFPSEG
jgi:hypothetical protein